MSSKIYLLQAYSFCLLLKKIPIKEDILVIKKKTNPTVIPVSADTSNNFSPYRKTNSLAPAPPMLIGITAAIDDTINNNR